MSTTTAVHTLKNALNCAKLGELHEAFRKVLLGDMLTPIDTGDVAMTAGATFTLPSSIDAWFIESVEVVATTGTAAAHGWYHAVPFGATPANPAAGGQGGGVAVLNAARTTLTFAAVDVETVRVRYIRNPATALTNALTA